MGALVAATHDDDILVLRCASSPALPSLSSLSSSSRGKDVLTCIPDGLSRLEKYRKNVSSVVVFSREDEEEEERKRGHG